MIGQLRGKIVESAADGTLIVDVGGVGYEVLAPLGTPGRLAPDSEGGVTVHIHTHVREDALVLYGFSSLAERAAFRALISVATVGPKLAQVVLGSLTVGELSRLIAAGAAAELSKIPGIGKKTAERIVLELEGKLPVEPAGADGESRQAAAPPPQQAALLHEALVRLGFRPSEAERAVAAVGGSDRPLGELVREALSILAP